MSEKIREALLGLDPQNDEHWTADGAPRLDVLANALGDQKVTRADVLAAAPGFSRENPVLQDPEPEAKEQPEALDLQALEAELVKARAEKEAAERRYLAVRAQVDAARTAQAEAEGHVDVTVHIQQYLATQKARRQAEGELAMDLRKNGVDKLIKLLPKRAPIDEAMARKRGLGTQRPQRG